jgi:hypothetical protein
MLFWDSTQKLKLFLLIRCSIIPTFWTLNDCNEAGLKQNPSAEVMCSSIIGYITFHISNYSI